MSSRQDVSFKSWPRLFRAKHAAHASGSSSRPAQDKTHPPIVDDDRLPRPKPRWNPTPEQVSILENYFNSGTMNPSREEIQRIKNLLLQFGNVEDANVFYWFQNKKSRTRQKVSRDSNGTSSNSHVANTAEKSVNSFPYKASEAIAPSPHTTGATAYMQQQHNFVVGDSASVGPSASAAAAYELGNAPPVNRMPNQDQTNQQQTLYACGNINPNLPYTNMVSSNLQSSVTVSINGHPVHMPPALLDIRSLFGVRAVIYDVSINQFLPMNDAGVTMWPLMNGHSYLVIDTGGFPGI